MGRGSRGLMRLYLDTMVWIYALEGHPEFGARAQDLMARIRNGRHITVTSSFLLAETLVLPVRKSDFFLVGKFKRALLGSRSVEEVFFNNTTAMHFATLRAAHRVKQPDAIHLALAATAGADAFITTDDRLNKLSVSGIGLIGDLNTTLP